MIVHCQSSLNCTLKTGEFLQTKTWGAGHPNLPRGKRVGGGLESLPVAGCPYSLVQGTFITLLLGPELKKVTTCQLLWVHYCSSDLAGTGTLAAPPGCPWNLIRDHSSAFSCHGLCINDPHPRPRSVPKAAVLRDSRWGWELWRTVENRLSFLSTPVRHVSDVSHFCSPVLLRSSAGLTAEFSLLVRMLHCY